MWSMSVLLKTTVIKLIVDHCYMDTEIGLSCRIGSKFPIPPFLHLFSPSPCPPFPICSSLAPLSSVVDEVWKRQTLLQLLQTVEVPMLDCILTSPARIPAQASGSWLAVPHQDLVFSNTCLERELPQTLNLPQSVLQLTCLTQIFQF